MGRPPLGRQPLTKAQIQKRWRRNRKAADVKAARQAHHAARVATMAAAAAKATAELAEPGMLYSVIMADPPWDPATYSDKGKSRHPSRHYPTMATDAIAAIQVPAAPDSVLFLWATIQMLENALRVMAAWQFTYKTAYGWMKPGRGHGYWSAKDQLELMLVGTKGKLWTAPVRGDQPPQVAFAELLDEAPIMVLPRGRHSAKPVVFYAEIEKMIPGTG
jgi:N6-adenosine-specific RNA methylase IME4